MHGIFRKGRILILLLMAALMMICVSASGEEVSEEEAALFSLAQSLVVLAGIYTSVTA